MLFNWYYKSFELLWRYLVKHLASVDLGSLDLEEVDEEMETDEASQSAAAAPKWLLRELVQYTHTHTHMYIFPFLGCPVCFWAFYFNSKAMLFALFFLGF